MEYFDFKTDMQTLDERSIFANRICKLLFDKHGGNLEKAIEEGEPYFNELRAFVRNIYELIETEIPLFAYHRLLKYGADNWDFDEAEYQEKLTKTREACIAYYKTDEEPINVIRHISVQTLRKMAAHITEKQKAAKEIEGDFAWGIIEEDWLDWLVEKLQPMK